jgi:hypothetical protein
MSRATKHKPAYQLGEAGEFIIENYNSAKPFASFFPGIAGAHGIPMWVFYVNRAQCICSVGIEDKEHPIMEFLSANRAFQLAGNQGFRTFLKLISGGKTAFYEPFQDEMPSQKMVRKQRMIIRPAQLTLEEENETLQLRFVVDYFNVPEDEYAGLIRVLRIENLSGKKIRFEILDGLPLIIPFGVDNYNLKHMRRLVESFVECINYDTGVPFFKGRVKQEDRPEVVRIKEGNFYLGFVEGARGKTQIVRPLVDPEFVFGALTNYSHPQAFLDRTPFRIEKGQILENRLPCAMGYIPTALSPGDCCKYYSIIGSASSVDRLNHMVPRIASASYVERKQKENASLIDRLTQNNFTHSSSRAFDLYSRQNFLDNTLRGGLPISLSDGKRATTLHLYSRKHGDLERDYNDYRLSATTYSQGNGNYRDVNQNRRNDLFINPDVRESNVEHFYNLIQLDGFNPLVVKTTTFSVRKRADLHRVLRQSLPGKSVAAVEQFVLHSRFTPGQLMSFLADHKIALRSHADTFIGKLLACCEKHQETDEGHGYWSDHWTYNLDLLENYLAVYPEQLETILLKKKSFTFFDNHHHVLPRKDKYVLWDGRPMQLGAVQGSHAKEQMIRQRSANPHEVRTQYGKGIIYRTTLISKMLSLITNKMASLDPFGVGVEMESDKPNWYDALNGLPGLMGSSISETLEVKRHILFMINAIEELKLSGRATISIYEEGAHLISRLEKLLKQYFKKSVAKDRDFAFWDAASSAKEEYREQTLTGVSGKEKSVAIGEVVAFLKLALRKLDVGILKALDKKTGVIRTYFINKVVKYALLKVRTGGRVVVKKNKKGQPCFRALKFKQIPLPLFLEGPVHYLRVQRDAKAGAALAGRIRQSGLFDRKLRMYKVNESLESQPMEIGRTRTFSPGWLENESIWLHMEYKYLLELLRAGLHDDFYRDIKTMLVPFLKPEVYGRSILENSSFIASSANPDPKVHGTGFVARLSGSTAEFIHILLAMGVGEKPFRLNEKGQLEVCFVPGLSASLFTKRAEKVTLWIGNKQKTVELPANSYSFMFLGNTLVTYHNPLRRNTFGKNGVYPVRWRITDGGGGVSVIEGATVQGVLARAIRNREVSRIEVELG